MKMKFISIICIGILCFVGLNSCFKEDVVLTEESQTYNRPLNVAVPLISMRFGADDLLNLIKGDAEGLINTDEEGLLHIFFERPFSYTWDDVVEFGDISLNESYDIPLGLKSIAAVEILDSIPLISADQQRFDEAVFKSGVMNIDIAAGQDISAAYTLTFTSLVEANGDSIQFIGNLNTPMSEVYDLAGAKADFVHNADQSVSAIEFRIDISDPEAEGPNPSSQIEISFHITDLVPEILTGYFGTVYPLDEEVVMDFSFFETFKIEESVQFKGANIEINLDNYFGLPVDLQLTDMFMSKSETGEMFEVEFLEDNTIPMEGAELADPIVPRHEYQKIDSSNSNIEEAINFFPDGITFKAIAKANPDGEIAGQVNFIQELNKFEGTIGLYFPFWLKTSTYSKLDTMEFDFEAVFGSDDGSFNPLDVIEYLELQLKSRNAMPFDLMYQFYPMTEDKTIIDSLFDEPQYLLKSSATDSQGKVDTTNVEANLFSILLDKEQIEEYTNEKVKCFLLKSFVSTEDGGNKFVQMHDFNFVEMKVMFEIKSTNN